MGLNAFNRADDRPISAVYESKHFKCKAEDKRSRSISQPIKNLMTQDTTMVISTRANFDFKQYGKVTLLGKTFQIRQVQIDYEETNDLINPNLLVITYLALQEVDR